MRVNPWPGGKMEFAYLSLVPVLAYLWYRCEQSDSRTKRANDRLKEEERRSKGLEDELQERQIFRDAVLREKERVINELNRQRDEDRNRFREYIAAPRGRGQSRTLAEDRTITNKPKKEGKKRKPSRWDIQ